MYKVRTYMHTHQLDVHTYVILCSSLYSKDRGRSTYVNNIYTHISSMQHCVADCTVRTGTVVCKYISYVCTYIHEHTYVRIYCIVGIMSEE